MYNPHKYTLKEQCILGAISGYSVDDLLPFVKSAQQSCPSASIVFIADKIDDLTAEWLEVEGVILIRKKLHRARWASIFDKRPRARQYFLSFSDNEKFRDWLLLKISGLASSRFIHYLNIIDDLLQGVELFFLSDVRDVVFQSDIFEYLDSQNLHCYLEDPSVIIGASDDNNIRWIANEFGEDAGISLAGKVSSCVGTIGGGREALRDYLQTFKKLLRHCYLFQYGYDQAIHNMIVQGDYSHLLKLHRNELDAVLTMCNMQSSTIKTNQLEYVVNTKNQPYPVLHHYDRHPIALEAVNKRFGGKPSTSKSDNSR